MPKTRLPLPNCFAPWLPERELACDPRGKISSPRAKAGDWQAVAGSAALDLLNEPACTLPAMRRHLIRPLLIVRNAVGTSSPVKKLRSFATKLRILAKLVEQRLGRGMLNGLSLCEYIAKIWTSEPAGYILNPIHQMLGSKPNQALENLCAH